MFLIEEAGWTGMKGAEFYKFITYFEGTATVLLHK